MAELRLDRPLAAGEIAKKGKHARNIGTGWTLAAL
jgi:hypothetical protein